MNSAITGSMNGHDQLTTS